MTPRTHAVGIRLGRFTAIAILGLGALLFGLFSVVLGASRQAVLDAASAVGQAESRGVRERLLATLSHAELAVTEIQADLAHGLDGRDFQSVESALFAELLHRDDLVEASWTYGVARGRDADGLVELEPGTRGQISVVRVLDGRLLTRHIHEYEGAWVLDVRQRPRDGSVREGPIVRAPAPPPDPTAHPSFLTPARGRYRDQALWSDLAFTELDEVLPEADRRKELSVQKAFYDRSGALNGVVRAGMLSDDVDRATAADATAGEHRFIYDAQGRLVTRLGAGDRYAIMDDDVRVVPAQPPAEVVAALAVAPQAPPFSTITSGGKDYFFTAQTLDDARTRDWHVGVLVPTERYLGTLDAARSRLLLLSAFLAAAVLVGGAYSLRLLRTGLGLVVDETRRIQRFDFARGTARATFAEVNDALGSLEVAKAALRAMGRYVPVELVRLLFRDGKEPELGGAPRDVTMMFTDIEGFTTLSETMPPDELAAALGKYLAVMTDVIRQEQGTVDKFIGDSVMVLWNAPLDVQDHAKRACRTALRARAALAEAGGPNWVTRFGIHEDTVLVGHFGSPDRISYTAIGDGVNLASRLEGLNKQYGTTILVSETVRTAVGDAFAFRRIDRVAVRGKSHAIVVHELVEERTEIHERYEAALDLFHAGRRDEAARLLVAKADPPTRALAARCAGLQPPDSKPG